MSSPLSDLLGAGCIDEAAELEQEFKRDPQNRRVSIALEMLYRDMTIQLNYALTREGTLMHPRSLRPLLAAQQLVLKMAAHNQSRDLIEQIFTVAHLLHYLGEQEECIKHVTWALQLQSTAAENHPLGQYKIRFLQTRSGTVKSIGHLISEPEFFIKTGILGWHPQYKAVALLPKDKVINQCGLNYWRRFITVITNKKLIKRLQPIAKELEFNSFWITLPGGRALYFWDGLVAAQKTWEDQGRGPLLTLQPQHRAMGREVLTKLGVPPEAWFVALHVRDESRGMFGRRDYDTRHTSHRDAALDTYELAVREIARRGGWVVRMGDISMRPMKPMPNAIDYVFTPYRSDWMDIYLVADSKFLLATASGPNCIPSNFGVPMLLTNASPANAFGLSGKDIYMPKLMRWRSTGQALTLSESIGPPFNCLLNTFTFDDLGVDLVNNTPEELRDATVEMLDRVEGNVSETDEERELQRRFRAVTSKFHPCGVACRIARDYARKYEALLS
jgi:putative glycosyltransferase (TIGR04372 family)